MSHPCKKFGLMHTKKYEPSVFSKFLHDVDDSSQQVQKLHSDVYMLLRQKSIDNQIGATAIREYIDSLRVNNTPTPQLTDDELFSLIEPREVNNITDAYKYAQYLEGNSVKVKNKLKDLEKKYKTYQSWKERSKG